jgi:hypothetical protein
MAQLLGRSNVLFHDRVGRVIEPAMLNGVLDSSGLREYQVVQRRAGVIEVNIGASVNSARVRQLIAERVTALFPGNALACEVVSRAEFVLSASGKRNAFVVVRDSTGA